MLLGARELLNLPVVTESGVHLGRLKNFEFEAESQTILRYGVQRSLLGALFLVSRDQVVSIDAKKMVVEDALVPMIGKRELAMQKPNVLPEAPLSSMQE